MTNDIKHISIIGASGFIGRHMLTSLADREGCELRVLVHLKKPDVQSQQNISFISGDLFKPETLDTLFEPNSTVINLVYLPSHSCQENLVAMENLIAACARKKIKRLIHCSSAPVAGVAAVDLVDENTPCKPISEYHKTKAGMERVLLEKSLGKFEVSILRPTAVLGRGGMNLVPQVNRLNTGNIWANYARSCLFYRKSINLVCVENVIAALSFLMDADSKVDREIFIVSDDDSPINNFHDVEGRILEKLGKQFPFKSIALPLPILKAAFYLTGKLATNPWQKYSDRKLASLGFKKPQSLEAGIEFFLSELLAAKNKTPPIQGSL